MHLRQLNDLFIRDLSGTYIVLHRTGLFLTIFIDREREREFFLVSSKRIFSYYKSPETVSYDPLILEREVVSVVYKQQNNVTLSTGYHRQYFVGLPLLRNTPGVGLLRSRFWM